MYINGIFELFGQLIYFLNAIFPFVVKNNGGLVCHSRQAQLHFLVWLHSGGCVQRQVWPNIRLGELLGQLWQLSNITGTTPKFVRVASPMQLWRDHFWLYQRWVSCLADVGRMHKMAGVAQHPLTNIHKQRFFLKLILFFFWPEERKTLQKYPSTEIPFLQLQKKSPRHWK